MSSENNILWGNIIKAHGVKGEVLVQVFSDDLTDYETLESVFVEIKQKQIPFFLTSFNFATQKRCILSFEDITTVEQAKPLVGADIYIPISQMAEADESRVSYQALMGFDVIDSIQGKLGVISNFFQKTGQDLLMMDYKDAEILIPVTEEIVHSVDVKTKQVLTTLPDGLIEIYLNEDVSESDED
ncbi:ribosome maturation factor RimM [Cytophaga aurantiaca]|uniref:ribosome maturation factor RimM n=1 Tax=Cytophaga aurantiaca TaxID=29530 RepID=UPI000361CCC8|nr:ribosome maturation factor RimM [Cytophaga aurantiaca]